MSNVTNPLFPLASPSAPNAPTRHAANPKYTRTPKESWDHSSKAVGTLSQKVKAAGKIAGMGALKAFKFVVTAEFIRIPVNLFLNTIDPNRKSATTDREKLKEGYSRAVAKQFENIEAPFVTSAEGSIRSFEQEVRTFALRELPTLKSDPAKLRTRLAQLSNHPGYDRSVKTGYAPAAYFLQECSEKLESVSMDEVLISYSERKIGGDLPDKVSREQFAEALQKGQQSFPKSRDNPIATILWAIDNVKRLFHVFEAETDPLGYDSYLNQMVFYAGELVEGTKRIIHKYTPGLTGPNSLVLKLLLPLYERTGKVWVHIDNQSMHTPDEKARISQVHEWTKSYPNTFLHAVLSTDTLDAVNQGLIERYKNGALTREAFVREYEHALRGNNNSFIRNYAECRGIHIPEALLNDEELDAAFRAARNMTLNNPDLEGRSEAEIATLLRRNILSTLSWTIMKKQQMRSNDNAPTVFTMNCKENFDRGPQENADMLFNEALFQRGQTLSKREVHLQSGINLSRADYGMRRPPQKTRMDPMMARWSFFTSDAAQDRAYAELFTLYAHLRRNSANS